MKKIFKKIIPKSQKIEHDFKELQKILGYKFNNIELLHNAISHTSLENSADSPFERMEFLGDSILGFVVSEKLFEQYPDFDEGQLSKLKAKLVSRKFLAIRARDLGIQEHIRLSKEAIDGGGKKSVSILANCMETIICAIYLDSSFLDVKTFILQKLIKDSEKNLKKISLRDYKTILQEYTQSKYQSIPQYSILSESGPEHDKTFFVQVMINEQVFGEGKGKNKKEAQQDAARIACQKLNI
jgi:ribonuclease-3